jgi:hypothetical protein
MSMEHMKDQSPSSSEWIALYQAAADFKRAAPWEWMYDSDLFGVQNPANGEVGYCCIMGNLGEHYALGVYLGTEGLAGYLYIQSGAAESPDMSVLYIQKCLMASYEYRDMLEQRDRALIKELGLKFRGRNAWPLFRSYYPGYHPWLLTSAEARFLTIALEQAANVALRYRDDRLLLSPPREGQYFVRVPEQRADGCIGAISGWRRRRSRRMRLRSRDRMSCGFSASSKRLRPGKAPGRPIISALPHPSRNTKTNVHITLLCPCGSIGLRE